MNKVEAPNAPVAMRKAELFDLLNKKGGIAMRSIRNELYDVIVSLRNVSEKEAKDTKIVYPSEIAETFNRFK